VTRVGVQILTDLGSFFKARSSGDDFSFSRPTFVSLFLIYVSCISPANADVDLAIGANARSYPLSVVTSAELGLSSYVWGSQGSSPWYGYGRLELSGATVGIYNSGQMMAEVFPLSFLGGRFGGESMQNDQDYLAYECEGLRCRGRFYRTFAEAELSLGAGPLFVRGRWRRERWTQKKDPEQLDFIDPTSGLVMSGSGDAQTIYHGLLGLHLSPRWSVVAGLRYAENQNRELSRFPFAMLRYQQGLFSAGLGGGVFESELKAQAGSAVGFLRWEIWPSPALR
jgi:hypothetical protein